MAFIAWILAFILLTALPGAALSAPGQGDRREAVAEANRPGDDREMIEALETKLKANESFINAARKAAEASADKDAAAYLRKAEALSEEGIKHYREKDYAFALEDISESNRMALYSIVLSRNSDPRLRESIQREEFAQKTEAEHEKKEAMIRKGMVEVEAFIKTGERLLKDSDNPSARSKIEEAKGLVESSKARIARSDYDAAISDLNEAYRLATGGVKEIKRSGNEIITFPKPAFADEASVFNYERKRNDTYVFLAERALKEGDGAFRDAFAKARSLRNDALGAAEKGDKKGAIEKLRSSTEMLVKALKGTIGAEAP